MRCMSAHLSARGQRRAALREEEGDSGGFGSGAAVEAACSGCRCLRPCSPALLSLLSCRRCSVRGECGRESLVSLPLRLLLRVRSALPRVEVREASEAAHGARVLRHAAHELLQERPVLRRRGFDGGLQEALRLLQQLSALRVQQRRVQQRAFHRIQLAVKAARHRVQTQTTDRHTEEEGEEPPHRRAMTAEHAAVSSSTRRLCSPAVE